MNYKIYLNMFQAFLNKFHKIQCGLKLAAVFLLFIFNHSINAATYHVSKTGNDANDGLSWANSFLTLHKALQTVIAGDEIWVAEGTYYPDEGPGMTNNNPSHSFHMIEGVGIYGGFNGTETILSQRDWVDNECTLSGEIGNLSDPTDNTMRIVFSNNLSKSAVIDGFTITKSFGGIATGAMFNQYSSPVISNCIFIANHSSTSCAGIYNFYDSYPEISNCKFENNTAVFGGGILNLGASPSISNCSFINNEATRQGAGIWNLNSSDCLISNCRFENNIALHGGGIYNETGSNLTISNSIFDNNSASEQGGAIKNINSSPNITNCEFNSNTAPMGGGVYNKSSDPSITNSTFSKNNSDNGGSIYNEFSNPTIMDCSFSENLAYLGGGVYNESSSPTITSCNFSANSSGSSGAMHNESSNPVITDCHFTNNAVQHAGGAMTNDNSTVEITLSTFDYNRAASGKGGAIDNFNSNLSISDCSFSNNIADRDGGAISNEAESETFEVSKCTFESNNSNANGGAIALIGSTITTIIASKFKGNQSSLNGGAITSNRGSVLIYNSIFTGNFAANNGGAYRRLGRGGPEFYNCTFTGNRASNLGGGIFSPHAQHAYVRLNNCILWGNSNEGISPSFEIHNSIVPTALLGGGSGNIDSDPLFVNPLDFNLSPTLEGDVHLQLCSPAIDKGLDTENMTSEDLDGNLRKFDAINGGEKIDMGAYEVQEAVAPIAICHENYEVALDEQGHVSFPIVNINNGSTGCGPLSFSNSFGAENFVVYKCELLGLEVPVSLTITDVNGNTASCSSTIVIIDNIDPIALCPINITEVNDPGQCGAILNYLFPTTATDNCGAPTISYSIPSGSLFPLGITTVVVTVTDGSGNTSLCTFDVIVSDLEGPTISCPEDITVFTDSESCTQEVDYEVNANDNCPEFTLEYSNAPGSLFQIGATTVSATVTDGVGFTSACSFTVTVIDNTPPTLICPENIEYELGFTECNKTFTYEANTGDNCDVMSVVYSPVSGSSFELGTTSVIVTVTDLQGNTSSCSFTVTITGDEDCDGVASACDLCPGGDDSIDNNNDGQPDCHVYPGFSNLPSSWICGNKNNKVRICHNGNNTLCVAQAAVTAHLGHGDYCGPCNEANCNNNLKNNNGIVLQSSSSVLINPGQQEVNTSTDEEIFVNLSPNPSSTEFVLNLHNHNEANISIILIDEYGRKIQQFETKNVHQDIRFGIDLRPGVYNLVIRTKATNKVLKIVKLN
ncbi:MAG: HYR domain-containing protein [Saprospiraceae bacterium]|nr:HYR domain-containing protein [Saprospiraceae bacterium]